MKNFLSSKDYRIYSILEYIVKNPQTTISEISNATNISTRTISNTISNINEIIEPCTIRTDFQGITLNIPNEMSTRHIMNQLLRHSLEFELLESILLSKDKSLSQFSTRFYVSENTVRRSITHINKNFKSKGIPLSIKNFQFVGDTQSMIIFFITLLTEKYYFIDEFMTTLQLESLNYIIDNSDVLKENITNPQDRRRVLIWMFIKSIIYRDSSIAGKSSIKFPIVDDDFAKEKFESAFNTPLTDSLLNFCFSFIVNGSFALSYEQAIIQSRLNPQWISLLENINTFISNISKKYDIHLADHELLILNIFNVLRFPTDYSYVLYSRDLAFLDGFSFEFSNFSKSIKREVDALFRDTLNQQQKSEFMYLLFSHWSSLYAKIKNTNKIINIGIYLDSDWEHAELLAEAITTNLESNVSVRIIESVLRKNLYAFMSHLDLLITNIPNIYHSECEVICLEEYPTEIEWTLLRSIIEKFRLSVL